jgi:hypothetical protein
MTNKHLLVFIAFTGILLSASAQKKIATKKPEAKKIAAPASKPNPWIFTYGKDTVYQQEFERLLTKNRKDKENPSKEEISEYLELYQNFKMKVKEAKLLQLDTFSGFKSELAGGDGGIYVSKRRTNAVFGNKCRRWGFILFG